MADIDILKKHSMPIAKARKAAQQVAEQLQNEYGLSYEWDADVLTFKKTGISGTLKLVPKKVEISITLGLLLRVFKEPMRLEIQKNLDAIFD
jgi:putative polyhydroxyalkanoate system protein